MPPVVGAITAVGGFIIAAGSAVAAAAGASFLVQAGLYLAGFAALNSLAASLYGKPSSGESLNSHSVTTGSSVEARKIVYGTAKVSGPKVFHSVAGTQNQSQYIVVALAGHECESLERVYIDDDVVEAVDIAWPGSTGAVTAGKYLPAATFPAAFLRWHLGTDDQAADTLLDAEFSEWTSAHRLRGVTYLSARFDYYDETAPAWENGAPQNVAARLKGRKVYDPRLDSMNGGTGAHRFDDRSTWAWSDNPVLCAADWLADTRYGYGVTFERIDWPTVIEHADYCDVVISVPGGTQKRYACNGVATAEQSRRDVLESICASMAGSAVPIGSKWFIRSDKFPAAAMTIDANDLRGDVRITTSIRADERFNRCQAVYSDIARNHEAQNSEPVSRTTYVDRDNGREILREIVLPFVNEEFQAQALCYRRLDQSDHQKVLQMPVNWRPIGLAPGDVVTLTLPELSINAEPYRCIRYSLGADGVDLTLREDRTTSYDDPAVGDYVTKTPAGTVIAPSQDVPAAQSAVAVGIEGAIRVSWTSPPARLYDFISLYVSTDDQWSNAAEVAQTRASFVDYVPPDNEPRWFWLIATAWDGRQSPRLPDSDTSTVTAAALLQVEARSVPWVESFKEYSTAQQLLSRWTSHNGAGVIDFPQNGDHGGKVLRVDGWRWLAYKTNFEFDPTAVYELVCRARLTEAPADPGNDLFYCGLEGIAADGTTWLNITGANQFGSQHYIAASAEDMGAVGVGTWQTYRGYVLGANGAPLNINSNEDPTDPATMYQGVKYVRPMLILNHLSGDGTMEVDFVSFRELTGNRSWDWADGGDIGPGELVESPKIVRALRASKHYQMIGSAGLSIEGDTATRAPVTGHLRGRYQKIGGVSNIAGASFFRVLDASTGAGLKASSAVTIAGTFTVAETANYEIYLEAFMKGLGLNIEAPTKTITMGEPEWTLVELD